MRLKKSLLNPSAYADGTDSNAADRTLAYLLLAPTIAVLLALTIYPLIYSIKISFQGEAGNWTLANFTRLAGDQFFLSSLGHTLVYAAIALTLEFLIGLGLALLLDTQIRGRGLFRALLLLVSHAPGRVLPTIRSRCRTLILRPLADTDVARAATAAIGETADADAIRDAAVAAGGSVGRALMLLEGDALELRQQVVGLLDRLPALQPMCAGCTAEARATAPSAREASASRTARQWSCTASGMSIDGRRGRGASALSTSV
jgi:hypothetical protein